MIAAVRKGDLYHPSYAGPYNGLFYMGMGFVYNVVALVDGVVPAAGFDQTVWTTPSAPFLLDHAFIQLTGACTASHAPTAPKLKLTLNGVDLAGGAMTAWGGTNYALGGANQVMWGLKNDKISGGLFSASFAGSGTADVGAMGGYSSFAALADGGSNGFWDKPVKLHVEHGPSGNVTMHVPFRVILVGRLL